MKVHKLNREIELTFINNEGDMPNSARTIKANLSQILLFKEALLKRLAKLKVSAEQMKLNNFITEADIKGMSLTEMKKETEKIFDCLERGNVSLYFINLMNQLVSQV